MIRSVIEFFRSDKLGDNILEERPANVVTAWLAFVDDCYKNGGVSSKSISCWSSDFGWGKKRTSNFFYRLESNGLIICNRNKRVGSTIELVDFDNKQISNTVGELISEEPKSEPKVDEVVISDINVSTVLTFDDFWKMYGFKKGDKRDVAERFGKLSEDDRRMIIEHIPEYREKFGHCMKLPSTYINQKVWLDKSESVVVEVDTCFSFEQFWKMYDKAINKIDCAEIYGRISESERAKIKENLPKYVASTSDKKYRKYPINYLSASAWNDEVVENTTPIRRDFDAINPNGAYMKMHIKDRRKIDLMYNKYPLDSGNGIRLKKESDKDLLAEIVGMYSFAYVIIVLNSIVYRASISNDEKKYYAPMLSRAFGTPSKKYTDGELHERAIEFNHHSNYEVIRSTMLDNSKGKIDINEEPRVRDSSIVDNNEYVTIRLLFRYVEFEFLYHDRNTTKDSDGNYIKRPYSTFNTTPNEIVPDYLLWKGIVSKRDTAENNRVNFEKWNNEVSFIKMKIDER